MNFEKLMIPLALISLGDEAKTISLNQLMTNVEANLISENDLSRQEIRAKIKNIIAKLLRQEISKINDNAHFTNDLGMDSLDTVELIMEVENQFDIAIPDSVAEKIETISQMVDVVDEYIYDAVVLYAGENFKDNKISLKRDYEPYYSKEEIMRGGLSSIIIPKGYRVELSDGSGARLIIISKRRRVKIKDLSKIKVRNNRFVRVFGKAINWNDKSVSVGITKTK